MNDDRETKHHGSGIYSRWSKRDNARHYFLQYRWTPPSDALAKIVRGTKGKAKKVTETVPADKKDGRFRLETARRLKATRDRQRRAAGWIPPHIAAKTDAEHDQAETERRAPLLYEAARDRFMDEEARDYADDGVEARYAFKRLGRFFDGKMLDEVTRIDIREFFRQRATATGAYEGYKSSVRSAEVEVNFLRAIYSHLLERGYEINDPCHRPKSRKKDSPFATYRVKHRKVTPGPETLTAIFAATKQAEPRPGEAAGRELIHDDHRALWMLCYATAARPESEPCRLRHGDVRFLDDGWALVSYTDAKNASSNRTIPVPPSVATALRGIMLDAPSRFEKDDRAAWANTRIFRKRTKGGAAWTEASYNKVWAEVVSVVPGIKGMWVRDLRATAKTNLRKSGISTSVAMRFLGHTATVHDGYDNVDASDLRKAAEALRPVNLAALLASHQGTGQSNAAAQGGERDAEGGRRFERPGCRPFTALPLPDRGARQPSFEYENFQTAERCRSASRFP